MSVVYRDLNIDCTKDNYKSEKVTGYEHGVKVFRLKPLNGNIPIDLSDCTGAAYVGTKSDGKIIGNACEIKDNKILLPLTLQMTTARGELKGHIEVYFPTGTLKFYGVNFEVFPSPETAEIESKDEFTLLETAISQAKNAYQIAVVNGFVGTESEWLENLKGADGIGITSSEINANGELVLTYSDGSTANVGVVVGNDYVLTDTDKTDIANIVINEYDSSIMSVLGGDSSVTE
ncbi:hypothetical protein [uncultured Ruminococcus sp.]|uniref:hypothetical protein n=1 Tax=uncultured Ruminococcus sp. TaxID=165186 RepID=UPI0025D40D71|nr:hypothetical protein [uncultured Ruminococcus sp.]